MIIRADENMLNEFGKSIAFHSVNVYEKKDKKKNHSRFVPAVSLF